MVPVYDYRKGFFGAIAGEGIEKYHYVAYQFPAVLFRGESPGGIRDVPFPKNAKMFSLKCYVWLAILNPAKRVIGAFCRILCSNRKLHPI